MVESLPGKRDTNRSKVAMRIAELLLSQPFYITAVSQHLKIAFHPTQIMKLE